MLRPPIFEDKTIAGKTIGITSEIGQMPIQPGVQIKPISHADFHALDYKVMGIVFSIQNDFGRFWNEKIYQNELAYRCRKAGFESVATEVPVHVSYKDFVKDYRIDLLIDNVIYELKTAQSLAGEHENQTINYLMRTGLRHAKLVNMRTPSVEHRFVSTNITPEKRYEFTIEDGQWLDLDDISAWYKQLFKSLLAEWGVFLDINLFYDAIVHFHGGEEAVVRELEVKDGARLLGKLKAHLLARDIAFKVSSVVKDERQYESHFRKILRYTSLKAIQWTNFSHEKVVFKTLHK